MGSNAIVGVATGGGFGLVGAAIMFFGVRVLVRERVARRWPKTEGTIVASSLEVKTGTVRDQEGYDVESTMYEPRITYRYDASGGGGVERGLVGSAVRLSPSSTSNAARANLIMARYPIGKKVDVFYNPADPAITFLETGTSVGAIVLTAFGGLFTAIGALVITLVLLFG